MTGEWGGERNIHHRPWLAPWFFVWSLIAWGRSGQLQRQVLLMKRPLRGTAVRGEAGEAPGGLRGESIALSVSPHLCSMQYRGGGLQGRASRLRGDGEAVAMETDRVLTNRVIRSDQIRLSATSRTARQRNGRDGREGPW